MNLWSAAAAIAGKDLRVYFRDKTGMLLGFLLPIALVTVFGMVMKFAFGGDGGMPKVQVWVVDEDGSDQSRKFVDGLRAVGMLSVAPKAEAAATVTGESLRQKVRDGEAHHALIVARGFGEALAAGKEPPLVLVRDPGRTMESRLVGIGLMQATMAAAEGKGMPWLMSSMMRRQGMSENGVERVRAGMDLVQNVIDRFVGGSEPDLRTPAAGAAGSAFDVAAMFEGMVPVTHEDAAAGATEEPRLSARAERRRHDRDDADVRPDGVQRRRCRSAIKAPRDGSWYPARRDRRCCSASSCSVCWWG
ncbi:MAG: ABC transporter permease [Planctomycetes bacterium]|nr:ABC transporter permease [Planctomycetota bacterium]